MWFVFFLFLLFRRVICWPFYLNIDVCVFYFEFAQLPHPMSSIAHPNLQGHELLPLQSGLFLNGFTSIAVAHVMVLSQQSRPYAWCWRTCVDWFSTSSGTLPTPVYSLNKNKNPLIIRSLFGFDSIITLQIPMILISCVQPFTVKFPVCNLAQ